MPGQGKKRKGYYIQAAKGKVARKCNDLRSGCKGFLVSCNNGKKNSHEATLEAYRILNEYGDLKYGAEKKEDDDDDVGGDDNLEDALKKAVSEIKQSNAKGAARRFQRLNCKLNSCIFIQADLPDPTELIDTIYEDLLATQVRKTRRCLRFLPVHRTCYASREKIVETVKEVCKPIFVEQAEEKLFRFCFLWKVSANSSPLSREDIYEELCEYVFSKHQHTTDYTDPEIAINIHVIGNTCCIGVLTNYVKFCKYNIDIIVKDAPVKKAKIQEDGEKEEEDIKAEEGEAGGGAEVTNGKDVGVDTDAKMEAEIEDGVDVKDLRTSEEDTSSDAQPPTDATKEQAAEWFFLLEFWDDP